MREETIGSIFDLAKADERVVFIGSDLGPHTLSEMKRQLPKRFFMEGISEQHIIGMASGLAMEGFLPYIVTISTFLIRRCLEQILIDACFHKLPLRLIGFGGGVVYAPLGPTHWATDDFALLNPLPGMTILAPCDAQESIALLKETLTWDGPVFLRLGKGDEPLISNEKRVFEIGKTYILKPPGKVAILSTGSLTHQALKACHLLSERGISAGLIHLPTVKPLDQTAILEFIKHSSLTVVIEEHTIAGGLGSMIAQLILNSRIHLPRFMQLALPNALLHGYGTHESLIQRYGLSGEQIAKRIADDLLCR